MLDKQEIYEIEQLVKEKRNIYRYGMGPLGDNIIKLFREIGIQIIYLPIELDEEVENPFSALYLRFKDGDEQLSFVGLNTQEYFDQQIFALAHELYHHYEGVEWSVCRFSHDEEDDRRESKANRFAAELLLPSETLLEEVKKENQGELSLKSWDQGKLLRFIARLHCDYQLPYKAIILRFREVGIVDEQQFADLLQEPVRVEDGRYYLIGLSVAKDKFLALNTRTCKSGVDGPALNDFALNYEEGKISLAELIEDLTVFGKELADFGIEEGVEPEDIDELTDFFGG